MKHLPLVYRELDDFFVLKANKELNEHEENLADCLGKLKKLIKDDDFNCCTDDDFLILFLRNKKFDVTRAFHQLKIYTKTRTIEKKYMVCNDFETIQKVLDTKIVGLLPSRDPEGRAILFFRASQYRPCDCSPNDIMRTVNALTHFALSFPATQVSGLCIIADTTINSFEVFQLILKYTKVFIPKAHCFPLRIKRIDMINMNIMVRLCFPIVKPFIPSKLLRRVTFLGDEKNSLLDVYPADILPVEFGGTAGPLEDLQDSWIADFQKFMPKYISSHKFYE